MTHNTPKAFVLQLGALLALYASLVALTMLVFASITLSLPDAGDTAWQLENAAERVRIAFAMLVVCFPTYLVLTRLVNSMRRKEQSEYNLLTKWLIYLSLLAGGAVLLGDVIAVIYAFLEGDTTLRFLLKTAALAVIIATAFTYYLLDVRGYWQTHERQSLQFGAGALTIVVAVLVWGLYNIEPPAMVRESNIDNVQIGDLQDMQWRIEDFYRSNEALPESLNDVYLTEIPNAPDGRTPYEYTVTSETSYQLCATFTTVSDYSTETYLRPPITDKNNTWEHPADYWCFSRTIDDTYRQ